MLVNGLAYYDTCRCAGTACGGHLVLTDWTPIGWQGPAQHTYTRTCDGLHAPGPCPEPRTVTTLTF